MENNVISNFTGRNPKTTSLDPGWTGGMATGIYLTYSNFNNITNNYITNNTGGRGGIRNGPGVDQGGKGGTAAGIYLQSSNGNDIADNIIYNNVGGRGASDDRAGDGGDGVGIY
ncbi:MAG: hypothetical protein OEX02_19815, partial [Cyclobacteriaceae bacterium]|nr:hypothetical protein [Cyclobacteriaceae bacterium]